LGVTPTAIRNRIKRGTLEHRPNGNMGKLVRVPLTVTVTVPEPVPPTVSPDTDRTIKALEAHVQTMRELLEERNVAHAAEMARLIEKQDQLEGDLQEARAEADHAKSDQVRMAREVATMFDELKALADRHAELHADRARLQAELESARVRIVDLHSQSIQARKEAEDAQAHARNLTEQFERVHREHRIDTELERQSGLRRWFNRLRNGRR
jgi:chromosome segregation ATPase